MKFAVPLVALFFSATLCAGSVFAADAKPQTPQQQKFGACAKEAHAKSLKGAEYKSYMSTCSKADAVATAPKQTQQEKMKTCNATAATTKDSAGKPIAGDDRKKFMSSCLSSQPAAH